MLAVVITRRALPLIMSCVVAVTALAAQRPTKHFDVPAGELATALRQLAEQVGVEFVYSAKELSGVQTAGAQGMFDPTQVVAKLLEGTKLRSTVHSSGAFLISRAPEPPASGTQDPLSGAAVSASESKLAFFAVDAGNEVIVTANLREEILSRVPISMSVWTQASMDSLGILDLSEAAPFTPGVAVSDKGNFIAISVRGIGSSGGAPTTGIYIDDTPLQSRALANSTSSQVMPVTFDLDRVEVLRGPQGTLFGAGSVGGTVRYITTPPSLTENSGYARVAVSATEGGQPSYEVGIAGGGPLLDDVLGIRASTWYRRDGGWIDRVDPFTFAPVTRGNNHEERAAARIAVTWAPAAALSLNASVFYQVRKLNDLNTYWDFLSNPGDNRFVSAGPSRAPKDDSFALASVKLTADVGAALLTTATSFLSREDLNNADGTLAYFALYQALSRPPYGIPLRGADCIGATACYPFVDGAGVHLPEHLHGYRVHNSFKFRQQAFSQELRLQSQASQGISWTIGAFFSTDRISTSQSDRDPDVDRFFESLFGITACTALQSPCTTTGSTPLLQGDTTYLSRQNGEDQELAGFGEVVLPLTDRFRLNTGLRYSKLKVASASSADGPINHGASFHAGSARQHAWTGRVGLSFQASADHLFYSTVATGFRPGGVNAPISAEFCADDLDALNILDVPPTYHSDDVQSLEIGAKNDLANRLSLAGSIFWTRWHNVQQSLTLPTCGSGYTTNLGEADSQGADLSLQWRATDSVELQATIGYTEAKYTQTVYATPNASIPLIEAGAHIVSGQGAFSQPLPPWTFSAGAQYNFHLHRRPAFTRLDYAFSAGNDGPFAGHGTVGKTASSPRPTSDLSYFTIRAGLDMGTWSVALFVDNLLNSHAIASVNNTALYASDPEPLISPLLTYSTFRPRTFGLTFVYSL